MSAQGSGEKTEKASPKKRRDAREKGEVHKSADLASALMLFLLFATVKIGYESFVNAMRSFTAESLTMDSAARAGELTEALVRSTYRDVLFTVLPLILPLLLTAMVCGILVHMVQTGPMFVTTKLKPDFGKISPLKGFQRIFSSATLMELFKSCVKILILGWIIYKTFLGQIGGLSRLMYTDVPGAYSKIMSACLSMGILMGLALIGFGAVDVFYQWWKYEKDLRMTKQEVKDENKQTEGDPQVKGKIRQKQRKMSAMRMMRRMTEEADVVVTNPTHFAVALRYKQDRDKAPVVVAKGQDFLAQRMKKLAAEHKISVVENKPVARALYAACEVGDEIPPELYQAIADILIYVYKTLNAQ